jgi:formylglycine-generating enzyme required for sulfatase activity
MVIFKSHAELLPSLLSLLLLPHLQACARPYEDGLVLVEGGSFMMGDVFAEGGPNELPTHQVTLDDFYLAPTEVTVADFEEFVTSTVYETSAEGPYDPEKHREIMDRGASGQMSREEMLQLRDEILRYSGAGYWAAEERQWQGYNPETNWRNPGFEQSRDHPVQAVSWNDAIRYCNWLSEKAGLAPAYDLMNGGLIDAEGNPTTDVTEVRGYRLPTEAEWEYAARERGRDVRFGTGRNTARSAEMNFRGDEAKQPYVELGLYRKGTTPVGTFPANSIGLHDISGNAWEWVSDTYTAYDTVTASNPYKVNGSERILRGGRWGGDAFEARVFHRSSWPRNDRCNNSGFRIARSAER